MSLSVSRPNMGTSRPAYLDNVYARDASRMFSYSTSSLSASSSNASHCDLGSEYSGPSLMSPTLEKEKSDAWHTLPTKKSLSNRRFRFGTVLQRRTYPQDQFDVKPSHPFSVTTTIKAGATPTSPPPNILAHARPSKPSRPSLPRIQTNFSPPEAISTYAKKPLPAVPALKPTPVLRPVRQKPTMIGAELNSQRCYYFAARNCQGWVLAGEPGDPCETCLQSGYFGAK